MFAIQKLTRDLRNAARTLSEKEARFLVDAYYQMQKDRIRSEHQARTLAEGGEPHDLFMWLVDQRESLEGQVKNALAAYAKASRVGQWALSITGIGPVITAGLLANIDMSKAPAAPHIWRYAGLDPTRKWEKGQKIPWNASLKRLCFLIGESFVKVSGRESDIYGKIYKQRKEYETAKNEAGDYAEQAVHALATKNYGRETEARKHYEAGRLPPAQIHRRAARYATKMFLSHLHEVWHTDIYGTPAPVPYAIANGHVHYIPPPNWSRDDALAAFRVREPSAAS